MIYVTNYHDNGPYFAPIKGKWHVSSLRDILFHVRQCMEDHDDYIAVFKEDECHGIWCREHDIQSDGEGGLEPAGEWYTLHRPGSVSAGLWNAMQKSCRVA